MAKGGFTVPEYSARVWDMSRNLLHPTSIYVVATVAGGARLLSHPLFDEPGTGALVEVGLFLAGFLGAWACFYSTLLRDAGLASLTVTVLVPVAVVASLALWFVAPEPARLSGEGFAWCAAALFGPGPPAWVLTMLRWRRHRAEQAALLEAAK